MDKFPQVIHVVREHDRDDSTFLVIAEGGVCDSAHFDETRDCAIYKLAQRGKVEVQRRFVAKGQKRG